jgi:hypothetical protein
MPTIATRTAPISAAAPVATRTVAPEVAPAVALKVAPAGTRSVRGEGPSRLGLFSGISTFVYLLAAVIIGTEMSGLFGLEEMGLYLATFCIAMSALAAAIVLDVLIGLRGGEGVRTAAISGLFLLLPPTAVAFYLVSATAMH